MPTIPKIYIDSFSSVLAGMNSGIAPIDLPDNQTFFNLNCSVRNGYLHNRPPYHKKTLNFNGNTALQTIFETGLFQGIGYYRPDLGTESLIFQIGGHLILATEVSGVWNMSDISISGDINSASPLIVWMWQSEKWMIVQDGTGVLPIFFDGATSRRSAGDSVIIGFVSATSVPAPPAIGALVTLTLNSAYTGQYNVPVLFNGEFYQALPNGTPTNPVYSVQLTNLNDATTTIPDGTNVYLSGSVEGIFATQSSLQIGGAYYPSGTYAFTAQLVLPTSLIIGSTVSIPSSTPQTNGTITWKITAKSGYTVTLLNVSAIGSSSVLLPGEVRTNGFTYPAGTFINNSPTSNNVLLGAITNTVAGVSTPVTVPAIGGIVSVNLTAQYTGTPGAIVQIGAAYYTIQSTYTPPPPTGTSLQLKNLTDTSTANYVFANTNIDYPAYALVMSVAELPAGKMGAYGMERNSLCLTDGLSYIMGDLAGGASGTPAYNYRDAVLKATENIDLPGGGSFRLPGSGDQITAMIYPPNLDTSLGQGALQVFTSVSCHSNNTSIDRTRWENPTSPLQTKSLDGEAALAQDSTFSVNSDTFFRSSIGIGSLVLARRDFGGWGNVPISNEMERTLDDDNESLLPFSSGKYFDNRTFETCHPIQGPTGVVHLGLITLNLELISTFRYKQPPAWESVWTGLNILKIIRGKINGILRLFALTYNANTGANELYEILKEKTTEYLDNGTTRIIWQSELPVMFNKDIKPITEICELNDGEVYLSNVQGDVHVQVFYRPDYYPCWTLWNEFDVCSTGVDKGYRMRVGLGTPSPTPVEVGNNRPLRLGYFFQFRIVVTGACTFNDLKVKAVAQPITDFAQIIQGPEDCQAINCPPIDDFAQYTIQGTV